MKSYDYVFTLLMTLAFWIMFSIFASVVQLRAGNCDKTYPINYVLYSKFFCEIEEVLK